MEVKLLEIRDRATFLPVMAVSTVPAEGQVYLLSRAGFSPSLASIILTRLSGESPSSADPYFWNNRTMETAHIYIEKNFPSLKDGDVVDVEFILGETTEAKPSERISNVY